MQLTLELKYIYREIIPYDAKNFGYNHSLREIRKIRF